MRDYYKDCTICIAADDASSDAEGFLNTKRPAETRISISTNLFEAGTGKRSTIFLGTDIAEQATVARKLGSGPVLSSRGWTLQEEALSPRTLHYTSTQLVWECQRQTIYDSDMNQEVWPRNSSFHKNPKRYFLNPSFGRSYVLSSRYPTYVRSLEHGLRWKSLLINYTKRSLTAQTDRLIAISGLAQEIQAQPGYTYWAGIWAEDVHLELS